MSNQGKKQAKTNDLFEDSFLSVTRTFNKLFLSDKITNTTAKICMKLFDYFSTETGRTLAYKTFNITELRTFLGKDNKLVSRTTLKTAVNQIIENNLFLCDIGYNGQEVMYAFYPRNLFTIKLFEDVNNGKLGFTFGNFHKHYKKADTLSINSLSKSENQNDISENEFTPIANSKSNSVNELALPSQSIGTSKNVESIVNNEVKASSKTVQESYIKETYIKEALTLEEKIIESEERLKAFLKSDEVKEEKEIMKDDHDLKNDVELDRIKSILVGQFGFYESIVEKFLTTKSIKCLDECIQLTITADEDGKITSNTRTYFKMKLENWVEKKDIPASSPRSSEVVAPKTKVPASHLEAGVVEIIAGVLFMVASTGVRDDVQFAVEAST